MSDKTEREYRQNMLTILDRFYRGRGGSLLTKDECEAMEYAISSIKTDLKYDLLHEETTHIADADKKIEPPKNDLGVDKSDEFEEWKLNEDKDCYLRIGDIVDRFKEIDEHYNHSPWTLTQIFSNLNILQRVECKMELPTPKNNLGVDCISRQSVLDKIQKLINAEQNNIDENGDYMNYARERVNAYEAIQFFVENDYLCPSVTPQELRKGHWIVREDNTSFVKQLPRRWVECSHCGWSFSYDRIRDDYCSKCGAEMRADRSEEQTETWHGYHGDITAPKGTFDKIYNECDTEDDGI